MVSHYHLPHVLIDTDVLVDYLRGYKKAIAYLEKLDGVALVSAITVAELYAGVREGSEREILDQFMLLFEVVPLDGEIAEQGGIYRRDYGSSYGTGLADALIAATAKFNGARLVTLNTRHFKMLKETVIPYKKT